jgi:PAS domain S-box-containing protein
MSILRTVLVITDSLKSSYDYEYQLRQDRSFAYRVLAKPYSNEISALFRLQQIDGILLEISASYTTAIEVLSCLKGQMGDRCPPIVVIDGDDAEMAVRAFKNGATDYLVKDRMTPEDLRLVMRSAIENTELRQELQRSQEQFQTSIENMLDCFGIFSAIRDETGQIADFRIEYLNEAACENNRMTKTMQIGRGLCEIFPAHRESGLFDEYCQLVETGTPLIKDSLFYEDSYGGQRLIRAFDIRATKLNDGFVASWRDITDRKQLELELSQTITALQASQKHHHDLAEAMPQIVWTADATGAVNYWNQRWYEYTGLSETESFGSAGVSAVHPDERDRTLIRWSQAIAQAEPFEIEYRIRRWDGKYHWFISRAIPTQDSQGQITSWIGTITDIDRQKRLEAKLLREISNHQHTEQDLRRGEERLKLAQLAADAGHWDWDIETNKIFWSTEYYSLCGIDPGLSPSYENWLASVWQVDQKRADQEVRAAIASNQNELRIEYRIHHSIRGVRWLLVKGQARFDASGTITGVIGFTFDITDRKQAEIALQRSQERLDLAMQAAQMGTWDWNIQTNKVNWSTNLEHLFGIASGGFDGRYETVKAMIYPDDLPWVEQALHRAIYEREDYNIEFRFIKPDGTIRWALGLGRVFYDAAGNPITMTGVDMDISERKQAEADLRTSEERFRDMADNAPAMIWVTDPTGYCTYLNRGWYDFTGQTEETGLGFGWLDVVHPEDSESSKTVFLDAINRQETFHLEYRLRRKDGEYHWAIDTATPWFDIEGQFKGYIGSVIDINVRKQAEAALAANEARLRGFVEANVIGIIYGDIYGNIHEANNELLRIVGYTREDLQTGRLRWIDITPPEYLSLDQQRIAEARANGACTPYEKEYIRRDGSRVPVLIGYSLVGEAKEDTVVFILDLSNRKQAEREREKLLVQEQAARAEAERANQIKDEFLAILSHELRSPLNPILGWTKLLQARKFDETRTAEALATIERNARLQTQLIDDLLDVAKILRGKLSLNLTSVNLSFVVEAATETVRTAAIAKSIELHPVLPNIGQVFGDVARLQQIVWNLLSNAIKFTPQGGRVDIQLERVDNQARIIVRDTGRGINPSFLPHIFESFRQEDASITRKHGGLGLGLAIVRQLVEAHDGTITAESRGEGLGATFTIYLPLLNAEPELKPVDELPPQDLDLKGVRVLTVDDDPDARDLLTVLLTQYGAEVLTVTSATEVLANLDSFRPNVLVSDIGMPDVDGYSLIQKLRSLSPEEGGQIPAIALTAFARESDYQQAIASGYQHHVTKPLEPEQLVQAVSALARIRNT